MHAVSTMSAASRTPEHFLPAAERVFCDPRIIDKLPAHLLPLLRKAAEVHLITYAATQAVRFREYRKMLGYVLMALRRSPLAMPRVMLRISTAFFGV